MKTTLRLFASIVLTILPAVAPPSARPQTQAPPAAKPKPLQVPELKFQRFKLDNGLDVILSEDHRLPLVAVDLWYHVGAANETAGRTGFAHLFEHMMFEGSKHVPGSSHAHYLESAGASDFNGTTSFDRTNYYETLPSNQLELALWLESDRMGYLPDKLDQANLSNQQDVVRNERRQSYENAPYGIAQEAVFHELFPKNHPYYPMVIGSHADIQAAKLEDVRNFFKLYYAPNNASLAIVGDIDPAKVQPTGREIFRTAEARSGSAARASGHARRLPPSAALWFKITCNFRAFILLGSLRRSSNPATRKPTSLPPRLGGGKSSRLYKKLVYEKQLALDVEAYPAIANTGFRFPDSSDRAARREAGGFGKSHQRGIGGISYLWPDAGRNAARKKRNRNAHDFRPGNFEWCC